MINSLNHPLTDAQLELLKLFNRNVDEADWSTIRQMITRCFAEKAIREVDALWQEKGWSEQTMKDWVSSNQRTPYRTVISQL